jgi:hypothetical protein
LRNDLFGSRAGLAKDLLDPLFASNWGLLITTFSYLGGFMKFVSFALVAATVLSLTACSDSQISFGAGVIVGAIISDDSHHHHRPNPPRYRGGRRHYAQINLSPLSPVERVAAKYSLTLDQSAKLTSELLNVQAGDLSGLSRLGFTVQDLVEMTKGQNPSASTLTKLGSVLGLSVVQTHDLIQNIKIDVVAAQESMM